MDIYDLINDFLEHLEIEAGRSKKTIENYRLYLERFVEISLEILNKDSMKASDITKELLRKYRIRLNRYGSDNGEDEMLSIELDEELYQELAKNYLQHMEVPATHYAEVDQYWIRQRFERGEE